MRWNGGRKQLPKSPFSTTLSQIPILPPLTAYLWEGGRKRRPLTPFSASFPHPVQGVSPAALNALAAAPGRQVYISALITPRYFVPTHSKNRPLSFCSLRARLGSLRILAASRILFKGRVRPLSVEDGSPQLSQFYPAGRLVALALGNCLIIWL